MLFNSLVFVIFFFVVYGLYVVLPLRAQNRMLLVASLIFYGWWDWRFLGLLLVTMVVDYVVAIRIARSTQAARRRLWLCFSIIANLGMLGYFKYANFFVDSFVALTETIGMPVNATLAAIVLPVGISFYTFQSLSYTIDVYRGELQPVRDFGDFALFVTYFPQLVAGPIERATVLLPQLLTPRRLNRNQLEEGCWLILYGYFLKMVVADNLSPFSERIFGNPAGEHGAVILFGVYSAAWQIFGDFAGYSNIARGISKLMGIELMKNFEQPCFAVSPGDFWRRWHISLSTWLRDYLYIPLGGNRGSSLKTYRNLMLTMLIGGLWHGAAWNFVAWGFFHGAILCIWRFFGDSAKSGRERPLLSFRSVLTMVGFFHVTCFGWMLFFVKDLRDVPLLLHNCIFNWQLNGLVALGSLCVFAGPVLIIEYLHEAEARGETVRWSLFPVRLAMYSVMLVVLMLSGNIDSNDFIYFQF